MSTYELPYAEDINYWQSSQTSPDTWIDKACKLIEQFGGTVLADGYGKSNGRAAYMVGFAFRDENYKIVFPVLPTKGGNERAARIQAATLLYHDVKAKVLMASIMGVRTAFFSYMMLTDGRTVTQLANPELADAFPKLLGGGQ